MICRQIHFSRFAIYGDLNNLILSPDSSKLISASSENFMVRVWDTGKLIEETTIKTLQNHMLCLCLEPIK
jgi:WD40 repeat protein